MNYRYNKQKAREYFGIEDKPDLVLHHILPCWKYYNKERYDQWNPEDLVVMTRAEHISLHHKNKIVSEETRQKQSEAAKSRPRNSCPEETKQKISNTLKGRTFSDETRKKMSESAKNRRKGRRWKLVDGKRIYWYE